MRWNEMIKKKTDLNRPVFGEEPVKDDDNDQNCKEVSTSEMGDLVLKELENEKI